MYIKGVAKKGRRTKELVNRLEPKDIAVIVHRDLDEMAALSLADRRISCIINLEKTISGRYPNRGPAILIDKGIAIFEIEDGQVYDDFLDGEVIEICQNEIVLANKKKIKVNYIGPEEVDRLLKEGFDNLERELDNFIENTLDYAKKEKSLVTGKIKIPDIDTKIEGRHVLIVVRGRDYKMDLKTIRSYIDDIKPVLIGVDGGGDALLEAGLVPDIIIGDMDSVSDAALLKAREVIVHGYEDGRVPGLSRVKGLGLDPKVFPSPGTSEDIALLLSYEKEADLIVALGSHTNMIDFLEKGRPGMASTFLTRLKVGSKLVDAKGVNKLYRASFKTKYYFLIILAVLIPILILAFINPMTNSLIRIMKVKIRIFFTR